MTYQQFCQQFKLQTESLSYEKQMELATTICKKLFFIQKFVEDNNWRDSDLVLDTITFIDKSKSLKVDPALLKEKINQILAVTPATEDFGKIPFSNSFRVRIFSCLLVVHYFGE